MFSLCSKKILAFEFPWDNRAVHDIDPLDNTPEPFGFESLLAKLVSQSFKKISKSFIFTSRKHTNQLNRI